MFANLQANRVPITPQQLLERPLEPHTAYAIDPYGTIEVDDAISVTLESARNGNTTAFINTYIADTALLGTHSELFDSARIKGFTDYSKKEIDYMMPTDVNKQLSLGNSGPEGSPAFAVRTRIHNGKVALKGIDRVRVLVSPTTYNQFERIAKGGDNPEARDIVKAGDIVKGLGYYSTHRTYFNAHDVVARYMIMTNSELAHYALQNSLPWIYRSHRGYSQTNQSRNDGIAHYTHRPRLHRGVGGVVYCHGTSPLRRFPDHIDQLQLAAHLDGDELPFGTEEIKNFSIEANNRMRQLLGRQSTRAA